MITGVGDRSVTMAARATSEYLKLPDTNASVMIDAGGEWRGLEKERR